MKFIKQAAVRCRDRIYTLPRPNRHSDIFDRIADENPNDLSFMECGFLTDSDVFVNRHEAAAIAAQARQIINNDFTPSTLYSEDIF